MGIPQLNLDGISEDYKVNAESGYFDPELEQISIKWASWLAREPEERLLWKLGWIFTRRALQNSPSLINKTKPLDPKIIQMSNDL